jgi:hypothetical protein
MQLAHACRFNTIPIKMLEPRTLKEKEREAGPLCHYRYNSNISARTNRSSHDFLMDFKPKDAHNVKQVLQHFPASCPYLLQKNKKGALRQIFHAQQKLNQWAFQLDSHESNIPPITGPGNLRYTQSSTMIMVLRFYKNSMIHTILRE